MARCEVKSRTAGGRQTMMLAPEQLAKFDRQEHLWPSYWQDLVALVAGHFGTRAFVHLDAGGGNGALADRLLAQFPHCVSIVMDSAPGLLARNQPHPRKRIWCAPVERLEEFPEERFDLITANCLLHHLVRESYHATRVHQRQMLRRLASRLRPGGRLFVCEHLYQSWSLIGLPGWLIYQLTSSRALAPLVRRAGANTAGVGVCFLSAEQWEAAFQAAGLQVLARRALPDRLEFPAARWLLALRSRQVGYYWLCRRGG